MFKRAWRMIVKYYLQKLNIIFFGVVFENEIMPEFLINDHAKERVMRRSDLQEYQVKQKAFEAWELGQDIPKSKITTSFKYSRGFYVYRLYQDLVWIFSCRKNKDMICSQKILITVLPVSRDYNDYSID